MKVRIITLGCKVNTYESEAIKEKFLVSGYEIDDKIPDIVVINTCSVTNVADNKCLRMIRKIKREYPLVILVVCGCMAENKRELLNDLEIDILIGNNEKSRIVDLVEDFMNSKKRYIKFYDNKSLKFEDMSLKKFTNQTRAFIKIQDGCDNYCTYCVIPLVRGNIRFKDFDKCLKEAMELVKNGHKEIVLTGIHTGSYGRGTDKDIVDLVQELSKIDDLKRIRISSIEITEITDRFLELLKNNSKICEHLHIPLQSGSDKILKLMNRKYNTKYFKEVIEKIRLIKPNISITTDVIVGFPNECEKDFQITYDFCQELNFSKLHVFPYSVRVGTKAATMENQVDNGVKKLRSRVLNKLSKELEINYTNKFIGKDLEVLVEENQIGSTSNYLKVKVDSNLLKNEMYSVSLAKLNSEGIVGVLEKERKE